ncbi:MAG TPA: GAF domain-containing protein [Lacibacter sp.]|nr:GAF domain-containing protein [Lacibacter sp.]HMO89413.1 GAF domain-containing protein [Lacibacter sp.]HMP86343.1 GAF domain-containing protein [Lacibacter sp.]
MAEDLLIGKGTRAEQYEQLLPQIRGLLTGEPDRTANLGNIAAALKEQFGWLWIGFYEIKPTVAGNDRELVLGPFQGPVACTRIRKGKGVCGTAWAEARTLVVPDVEQFAGHIACSSKSRSEIVVPLIRNGEVVAVLDADSEDLNAFDATDDHYLQTILDLIEW